MMDVHSDDELRGYVKDNSHSRETFEEDRGNYIKINVVDMVVKEGENGKIISMQIDQGLSFTELDTNIRCAVQRMYRSHKVIESVGKCNRIVKAKNIFVGDGGLVEACWTESKFYPGGTLEDIIRERRKIDDLDALLIIHSVASALETIHAKGNIHRFVQPSNIFIDRNGHARLGGMSCARRRTTYQTNPGNKWYADPERIEATRRVWTENDAEEFETCATDKSDMWAFGLTVMDLVTGSFSWDRYESCDQQSNDLRNFDKISKWWGNGQEGELNIFNHIIRLCCKDRRPAREVRELIEKRIIEKYRTNSKFVKYISMLDRPEEECTVEMLGDVAKSGCFFAQVVYYLLACQGHIENEPILEDICQGLAEQLEVMLGQINVLKQNNENLVVKALVTTVTGDSFKKAGSSSDQRIRCRCCELKPWIDT